MAEESYPVRVRDWKKPSKLFKSDPLTVLPVWFDSYPFDAINLETEVQQKQRVIPVTSIKLDALDNVQFNPWHVVVFIINQTIGKEAFEYKLKNEKIEKDAWDRVRVFRARVIAKVHLQERKFEFSVQIDLTNGHISFRLWVQS